MKIIGKCKQPEEIEISLRTKCLTQISLYFFICLHNSFFLFSDIHRFIGKSVLTQWDYHEFNFNNIASTFVHHNDDLH